MLKVKIQGFSSEKMADRGFEVAIKDGESIGVAGNLRNRLMFALIGKEPFCGDISIDEISIKENYEEYIRQVGYISALARRRLKGPGITVDDFMDLAVMMRMDVFDLEQYQRKKAEYLDFFGIEQKKRMEEMTEAQLLLMEFILVFLKNPKLILIDDFFSLLGDAGVMRMVEFLKRYLAPDRVSVIASEKEELLRKITDQVFIWNV